MSSRFIQPQSASHSEPIPPREYQTGSQTPSSQYNLNCHPHSQNTPPYMTNGSTLAATPDMIAGSQTSECHYTLYPRSSSPSNAAYCYPFGHQRSIHDQFRWWQQEPLINGQPCRGSVAVPSKVIASPHTQTLTPGPILAANPLVLPPDRDGVQRVTFEYPEGSVKMQYTIRCDVESVDTDELSPKFKEENCVYLRACDPAAESRGNRWKYETDCNRIAWGLAQLNITLRCKRGLLQRAVDTWRNSNKDPRLWSRRARRLAKEDKRKKFCGSRANPQ